MFLIFWWYLSPSSAFSRKRPAPPWTETGVWTFKNLWFPSRNTMIKDVTNVRFQKRITVSCNLASTCWGWWLVSLKYTEQKCECCLIYFWCLLPTRIRTFIRNRFVTWGLKVFKCSPCGCEMLMTGHIFQLFLAIISEIHICVPCLIVGVALSPVVVHWCCCCCCCENRLTFGPNFHMLWWISTKVGSYIQHG